MKNFSLNKLGFISAGLLILIMTTSCSTLFHWKKREVMVESFPQGASVYYDNNLVGQTPCAVKIKNKPLKKQTIKIEKENYSPTNIKLKRKIHGSFWLNGIFVFVFSPIDFVTGKVFKYDALEAKVLKPVQGFYSPYDSIPNLKSLTIWDEELKLSKAHFQGKIPKNKNIDGGSSNAAAAIVSYFICKYKISENKVDIYSFAVMDKKLTWKRKGGLPKELLAHEKAHFDITEIYCRKLKKYLATAKVNPSNCNEIVKEACQKYWNLMRGAQVRYDKETAHSINEETQKLWEHKITEELDSSKKYTSPVVEIKF